MKVFRAVLMILPLCFSFACAEELILGSRGEDVAQVQQRLIELGYLTGTADGQYGMQTAKAVEQFQKTNGLSVTGTVNQKTYDLLFSEDAKTDPVISAQNRLIELGFLTGNADGVWGQGSAKALKHFQRVNDLEQTGELDERTTEVLMSEEAQRDDLLAAQRKLSQLGYYSGAADGIGNDGTTVALKSFQTLHGVEPTGELDETTIGLLDEAAPYEVLQNGSEGEAVVVLQERLIQFGFLEGEADGEYGQQTVQAVKAFQEHLLLQGKEGVKANGTASSLTQEYLFSGSYSTYIATLESGDIHSDVERIERRLKELGYMDAEADDTLDDYAANAIRAFQQAEELPYTGLADQATVDRLFSGDALMASTYVPHEISPGDSGEAVRMVQKAMIRYGMFSGTADGKYTDDLEEAIARFHTYLSDVRSEYAGAFAERNTVSIYAQELLEMADLFFYVEDGQSGAEQENVSRIQRRLFSLYYLSAYQIDGNYGESTRKAISTFQRNNGLSETGIADEVTQKLLFSENAIGNWTPYKLEIRISEQRVYVYQLNDEKEYVQIDRFICSTGLGSSTPTGVFLNTGPMNVWHYFKKFDCWAQYSYQIDGDILFHSVLYSEKDTDTLRESSLYALGSKASHGCVRLKVEDARWIYNNCQKGTIVEIIQ